MQLIKGLGSLPFQQFCGGVLIGRTLFAVSCADPIVRNEASDTQEQV